jgi:hypothetical protein
VLTKTNWNGTQFDGALSIARKSARQVGDILRMCQSERSPTPTTDSTCKIGAYLLGLRYNILRPV